MRYVTVKNKFQVVIPVAARKRARIGLGDLLECIPGDREVRFVVKSAVDRALAEGLEDIRKGRVYGPFNTAQEMIASLHAESKKAGRQKAKRV